MPKIANKINFNHTPQQYILTPNAYIHSHKHGQTLIPFQNYSKISHYWDGYGNFWQAT